MLGIVHVVLQGSSVQLIERGVVHGLPTQATAGYAQAGGRTDCIEMTLPFDEQEIRAAFDGATFQRGRHYGLDGAVRGLEFDGGGQQLWAQVRGKSAALPFQVTSPTAVGAGSSAIAPAGRRAMQHGAAVMLSGPLADRPAASLPLPRPLASPPRRHLLNRSSVRWAPGWLGWRRPSAKLRFGSGPPPDRCSICCRPGPAAGGRGGAVRRRRAG